MFQRVISGNLLCAALVACGASCRSADDRPPPDARRPVIRTQAELAAERTARIASGEVVANTSPTIKTAAADTSAATRRPAPLLERPGDIRPDILLVNDSVLTVAEILYPMRDEIREARQKQTATGFRDLIRRRIRTQVRQQIGLVLIYAEAMSDLSDPQKKYVDDMVAGRLDTLVAREFGGSTARLGAHLAEYGLTLKDFKRNLQRELVSRQYLTEKLKPSVQIRPAELRDLYRRNLDRYSTPATRELLMIEAPFDKFLPAGATWESAADSVRRQAKLRAVRHIRAAQAALADKPFEEVAREFSRGLNGPQGGSWGQIGRPLQEPFFQPSRLIFTFAEGQTSDPVETESGWYIVRCGKVKAERQAPFSEVQVAIRAELEANRFNEMAGEYIIELAGSATISSMDAFVNVAVERAAKFGDASSGPLSAR